MRPPQLRPPQLRRADLLPQRHRGIVLRQGASICTWRLRSQRHFLIDPFLPVTAGIKLALGGAGAAVALENPSINKHLGCTWFRRWEEAQRAMVWRGCRCLSWGHGWTQDKVAQKKHDHCTALAWLARREDSSATMRRCSQGVRTDFGASHTGTEVTEGARGCTADCTRCIGC